MPREGGPAAIGDIEVRPALTRLGSTHLVKFDFSEHLPTAARAEGIFVYDTAGRRYLDGCSGAVSVNIGHSHPAVLESMRRQAGRLTFTHRGAFTTQPAEQLADRLSELTGYPYVLLCKSGSEAIEAALKLVLQMWRERGADTRRQFASHVIGYHGSTLGALSLSGHPQRRWAAEPLLYAFNVLTPPYAYRYALGDDEDAFTARLLAEAGRELERLGDVAAGVVVEPIGGAAGGAITPPPGYLVGLSDTCQYHGLPLVVDEVMTGLGRTGHMLAVDHYGVRPDIVAVGKGLGAGYSPISAVLVSSRIIDAIADGSGTVTNGHTYGGNPLSCAAALAVLEVITSQGLIAAARVRGDQLRAGLEELRGCHRIIGEVRGLGLLQGIELGNPDSASGGIGNLTRQLVNAARDQGLLLYPATGGINDAVLVAPPMTSTAEEIDLLLGLLDKSLSAIEGALR